MVGYTIQLDRVDIKWKSHVKTNKKGEYIYIGLAPGNYRVTLLNPDGKPSITRIEPSGSVTRQNKLRHWTATERGRKGGAVQSGIPETNRSAEAKCQFEAAFRPGAGAL